MRCRMEPSLYLCDTTLSPVKGGKDTLALFAWSHFLCMFFVQ